jgi:hypothetical protein
LAQQNPGFKPIQDFVREQAARDGTQNRWAKYGGTLIRDIPMLGKEQVDKFFKFAFRVRLEQIKHDRALTDQEKAQIAQTVGVEEKTFVMYQRMQQQFQAAMEALRQADVQDLQANTEDPAELARAIKRTNDQFAELTSRDYFPLKRFGRFMVSAYVPTTDPKYKRGMKIEQLAMYETLTAAREAGRKMEAQYRADGQIANVVVSPKPISPEVQNLASLPPDMANRIADRLGLTAEQRAGLDRMVGDRITENSYLQHLKRAKG